MNQARFKHMQSNANEEQLIHHNMYAKSCRVNDVKRSQDRQYSIDHTMGLQMQVGKRDPNIKDVREWISVEHRACWPSKLQNWSSCK